VAILAANLNFSKPAMMPAQYNLDYLTPKHHPATKLSLKQLHVYTTHQLHKYRSFLEQTHFGGHIGGHFL